MKSKKIILAGMIVLFAYACFAQTLKIASIAPARSVWDIEANKLAQNWYTLTNGKVQMKLMNATAMGGEIGVIHKLNAVRPGQKAPIDGAVFTNIGIADLVPEVHIMTLCAPFLFRDQGEVDVVYETIKPLIQSELSKKGYVFLGTFSVGWAYFYTKKPVHTPTDLKTQKLSVAGLGLSTLSDSFKEAGFNTIDIAPDKLLQSVKTPGGAEGFYTIPLYAYAGQYYKSLPYILNAPICPVIATFIISKAVWDSFSEAERKVLSDAVRVAEENFVKEQQNTDAEYLNLCVQGGCTLVTLTPEEYRVMEETLSNDAYAMAKTGLMDVGLYTKIKEALKKHRGE